MKVFEGENDNEMLITRHSQFSTPINILNIYGEQENRTSKEIIQDKWSKVLNEVSKVEAKEELLVIFGDMNKHIGNLVEGNERDKISFGGQLIKDLIDTGKYILVNATKKAIGGPFTRVDPSDPLNDEKKSVLVLCIVSKDLFPYIESLVIDKERKFTPFRPVSKQKVTYTDHYSLLLTFKNLLLYARDINGGKKVKRWNTNKEGGWEAYKELTKDNLVLKSVANEECDDSNKMMKKMDKELDSIKFKTFGKSKEKSKLKVSKELEDLQKEKVTICSSKTKNPDDLKDKLEEIDGKIAASLLQKQREVFETELKELKDLKNSRGKAAAVFKTKEKIVGSKKASPEAVIIVNPKQKLKWTILLR